MRRLNFLPVIFLLVATSVAAMSFSSLIKQAEVIKVNAVTAATNTAITVSTTIRGFAANDPYQIKKLDVPKATYMNRFKAGMGETGGLKGLMKRNAWYAGWLATMAAAGWAIDELHDQVTKKDFPMPLGGYVSTLVFRYISTGGIYGTLVCTGQLNLGDCLASLQYAPIPLSQPTVVNKGGYLEVYYPAFDLMDNRFTPGILAPGLNLKFNLYGTATGEFNDNAVPVTDDVLYDSLVTAMLQDPENAAHAFMVPDAWPYPYPQIFPDTVPYVPGVAESDEEALNWYLQGLAQSTDPNAAYYVAPDRLQQIAALAQQLQQAQSPEGQTDALNDNLKNPLTQSQLEETLKKRDAANKKEAEEISATDKKPITDAYKDSGTKDEFDKLKERVSDPSKLPQLPPLPAADQIDLPSHTPCRTITMNMFNAVLTFPNPDQCTKLEQVKTGLGYLLYVLTALGIVFELYRRVE